MNTTKPFRTLVGLLLLAAAAEAETFELVPGVLVEPEADALYLMVPGGGVEKISLAGGHPLWASSEAAKPLALDGNRLLAQVEPTGPATELAIALLDAGNGGLLEELRVGLPEGVWPRVDEGMDRSFRVDARVQGSTPLVTWEFEKRYMKGIPPGPDEPLRQTVQAAYRLDPAASRLVPVPPTTAAAAPPLPASAQAWAAAQATVGVPPAPAGGLLAATRVEGDMTSPEGRIQLARWDAASGAALPEVELFSGPHVLQLRSADGRHLLVSEHTAPGDDEEYEWSLFSLATGELVGRLRHERSHARFFVAGGNVVLVELPAARRVEERWETSRRRLRAAVLGSGSTVWERPLRDTAYYGPFPP